MSRRGTDGQSWILTSPDKVNTIFITLLYSFLILITSIFCVTMSRQHRSLLSKSMYMRSQTVQQTRQHVATNIGEKWVTSISDHLMVSEDSETVEESASLPEISGLHFCLPE
jgi:hypothetical protein